MKLTYLSIGILPFFVLGNVYLVNYYHQDFNGEQHQLMAHEAISTELRFKPTITRIPTLTNTPTPLTLPTVAPTPRISSKSGTSPVDHNSINLSLLKTVNDYRQAHGLSIFSQNGRLCTLAKMRINQLIKRGEMDHHEGFNTYFKNHKTTDLGFSTIAENLSKGYKTNQGIVNGWDSSEPHRVNLLAKPDLTQACAATGADMAVLLAGN